MSQAYQMVTCRDCSRHYQCLPDDDYYNATTVTDGRCEKCFLASVGYTEMVTMELTTDLMPLCQWGGEIVARFQPACTKRAVIFTKGIHEVPLCGPHALVIGIKPDVTT